MEENDDPLLRTFLGRNGLAIQVRQLQTADFRHLKFMLVLDATMLTSPVLFLRTRRPLTCLWTTKKKLTKYCKIELFKDVKQLTNTKSYQPSLKMHHDKG